MCAKIVDKRSKPVASKFYRLCPGDWFTVVGSSDTLWLKIENASQQINCVSVDGKKGLCLAEDSVTPIEVELHLIK